MPAGPAAHTWRGAGERPVRAAAAIASSACDLADLAQMWQVAGSDRDGLALTAGWSGRWTATWKAGGQQVSCLVNQMGAFPVPGCQPVRHFGWATRQGHRPGLEYLASTGRSHGFESHAEQRLLLALDFPGVTEVVSQPHRMRFETAESGVREHTPDFLAVTSDGGRWLLDVRPAGRIEAVDRVKFAASAEAALACGWRYGVVGGWQPHVMTTLDTLPAQRRPLADRLGLMPVLLAATAGGPARFADLVDQTAYPAVARAFAIHLIWHRELAIDLARPLGDDTLVWPAAAEARR